MRLKNSMHDDSIIEDATKDIDISSFCISLYLIKNIYIIWVFINFVIKVSH